MNIAQKRSSSGVGSLHSSVPRSPTLNIEVVLPSLARVSSDSLWFIHQISLVYTLSILASYLTAYIAMSSASLAVISTFISLKDSSRLVQVPSALNIKYGYISEGSLSLKTERS